MGTVAFGAGIDRRCKRVVSRGQSRELRIMAVVTTAVMAFRHLYRLPRQEAVTDSLVPEPDSS